MGDLIESSLELLRGSAAAASLNCDVLLTYGSGLGGVTGVGVVVVVVLAGVTVFTFDASSSSDSSELDSSSLLDSDSSFFSGGWDCCKNLDWNGFFSTVSTVVLDAAATAAARLLVAGTSTLGSGVFLAAAVAAAVVAGIDSLELSDEELPLGVRTTVVLPAAVVFDCCWLDNISVASVSSCSIEV